MRPGPGKFEGCADLEAAERLYERTLESDYDEMLSAEESGGTSFFLLGDTICSESDQGFFDYTVYGSEGEARSVWVRLEAEMLDDAA